MTSDTGTSIMDKARMAKQFVIAAIAPASAQLVEERLAICNGCEVQNKPLKICTACGCFLPAKTKLLNSACPMELW